MQLDLSEETWPSPRKRNAAPLCHGATYVASIAALSSYPLVFAQRVIIMAIMPYAPNKPCVSPGCPALVPPGQKSCAMHRAEQQLAYNRQRPAYHQFYHSPEWRNFRRYALATLGRRCVDCGCTDRIQLDHILPVKDRPDLALEITNVAPRCASCHSRRTAMEHGRWG